LDATNNELLENDILINIRLPEWRMAPATSAVQSCANTYSQFEAEMDSLLDQFLSASEQSAEFYRSIQKVEEQVSAAKRLLSSNSDLELNETVVIAEKTEAELASAEKYAHAAALTETQEEWAEEIEKARGTLERLSASVRKLKSASEGSETLEIRSALLAFKRDEKIFNSRLAKLKNALSSKKHPAFAELKRARMRVQKIKSDVGRAFETLSRRRLRRKTAEAKQAITEFVRKAGDARVFVDAKHITLVSGRKVERMPLTQSMRFALEDMAPIGKSFSRLGRNGTVLIGVFEKEDGAPVLRIGERSVVGDSIVLRERKYALDI